MVPYVVFMREVDRQIEQMKKKIDTTRSQLIKKGILEKNIIYVKRNGNNTTDGDWFYDYDEVINYLFSQRDKFTLLPEELNSTVYDCFAMDGNDVELFKNKLTIAIQNNYSRWYHHIDVFVERDRN